MARLIIIFIIAFLVYVAMKILLAKKNLSVKQFLALYFTTLIGLLLLYLGISGRLHPLAAVIGAALPFIARIMSLITRGAQFAAIFRLLRNLAPGFGAPTSGSAKAPGTSEIRSRYIHMILSHDTGGIDGTILEGRFKESKLSKLALVQLMDLLKEIQDDQDSVNLLIAYLEREHPEWEHDPDIKKSPPKAEAAITEAQALDILGLESNATKDEVIRAHRKMMQKLHPDRGGSTYLATKVNAAKELLLKK